MRKLFLLMTFILLISCASPPAAPEAEATEEAVPPAVTDEAEATEVPATPRPADEAVAETAVATRIPAEKYEDLNIVTLLPPDAIPAIDDPNFLTASQADGYYDPDELVIGVEFNGDARAYSIPFLSNHEIVNDIVGGVKIAVTW